MARRREPSRREALAGGLATIAACTGEKGGAPAAATIDTIVVLMMENRSFDHYLGSLSLAEGRAVDGLQPGMQNPDADGVAHAPEPTQVDCVDDPGHGWAASHDQFAEGANDGFVRDYGSPEVMNYHTRADLPITYALADAYTVCDRYFCSVMGPTWPNRLYAHAGTSDGARGNDLPDEGGAFTFPTVWTRLDEAGVSWRYYYVDVPFLGLFAGHMRNDTFAFLEEFVRDAERGELPSVVWIDPGFTFNDDHPPHHPGLGQELIKLVYETLARSPHWGRCLLLITYDEHGGFYDHVPPPKTDDDFAADGFDQLGFRVPSLAIGPYVRPGADSTVYDHTSWLKFVCERFEIAPWTKRIAAANSLGAVLDADRMAVSDAAEPVDVPAWDLQESDVADECMGAGAFGPTPPPLAAAVPAEFLRLGSTAELIRWIRAQGEG